MLRVCLTLAVGLMLFGCGSSAPRVVVYTALDQGFSEPILTAFEAATGVACAAKYDTESTKTVGLVNALRAEAARPRCDVFWNNEIVNTLRLQQEGLLQPVTGVDVSAYPEGFSDPDGYWFGFAARARVLLVNTNLVPEAERPTSIRDMTDPKWKGRVAIAKPLFGTTATHVAVLYDKWGEDELRAWLEALHANEVQIHSGNRQSAAAVGQGLAAFGLTDTDDAMAEIEAGSPVAIIYPDREADQDGVLFIPNTLAVPKGAPNPDAAKKLIEHLLSRQIEDQLASGDSAQIPLRNDSKAHPKVATPQQVHPMSVNWKNAAAKFADSAKLAEAILLQ